MGNEEWMSPRTRRDFGVADDGKKSGSLDGAFGAAWSPRVALAALRRALEPFVRGAEPGANSGRTDGPFPRGVPWEDAAAGRGEEDGKRRGELDPTTVFER